MGRAEARAESIVRFMERIAPSEEGAIAAVQDPSSGKTMILWNLLPPDALQLQCVVAPVEKGFVAIVLFDADDEGGGEPSASDPSVVASFIHTDDEIARKIVVFGAQALDEFRSLALRNQNLELAQFVRHFHGLIQEGLQAWGAGAGRAFTGVSAKLSEPADAAADRRSPQGLAPEMQRLRSLKNKAWLWVAANVGMIVVAGVVSLSTYQDAADSGGGTYYVWWGPVVWGVINLFRFGPRLVKLNKLERQLRV